MTKEPVKVTVPQVNALLSRTVGGIYIGKGIHGIVTNYFEKYIITENKLEIKAQDRTVLIISIGELEQYINYAVSGQDLEKGETWEGSIFFDYKFYLEGYMICFNVEDKGTSLAWAQFQELINNKNNAIFEVRSKEAGAFYLAVDNCTIDVNDREIEMNSSEVNAIIDRDIIETIYNDSITASSICYRLKFQNGMSDISIKIESDF